MVAETSTHPINGRLDSYDQGGWIVSKVKWWSSFCKHLLNLVTSDIGKHVQSDRGWFRHKALNGISRSHS
jgi:hypothetical protein